MNTVIALVDKLNQLIKILLIAAFVLCLGIILLQVLCRSALRLPIAWTEELARYTVVYIVYFAAALAARYGKLTRLEVLVSALNLSEGKRRVIDWIAALFSIAFWLTVVWCVHRTMGITKRQMSAAMKIPMYLPYMGIFAGSILLTINSLVAMLRPGSDSMYDTGIESGID